MENFLNRSPAAAGSQPLNVLPCHAAIEDSTRAGNLKAFLAPPDQAPMALVCTDRASRGLDSSCCSHVVLFDFPRDPSEYMRRCVLAPACSKRHVVCQLACVLGQWHSVHLQLGIPAVPQLQTDLCSGEGFACVSSPAWL